MRMLESNPTDGTGNLTGPVHDRRREPMMPRALREFAFLPWLTAWLMLAGCAAMNPESNDDAGGTPLGDAPPAIALREPSTNLTVARGDTFTVRWVDSDIDSNADISVLLFSTVGGGAPVFVAALTEDDDPGGDPDFVEVDTSALEPGGYHVLVTISDGVNPSVSVFAFNERGERTVVSVVEVDE
jgi:hypothetical protein